MRYTHGKFKASTKSWISIEKLNRVFKFNQETWQRKILKNEAIFGKAMEIVRNYRNIKCATN